MTLKVTRMARPKPLFILRLNLIQGLIVGFELIDAPDEGDPHAFVLDLFLLRFVVFFGDLSQFEEDEEEM